MKKTGLKVVLIFLAVSVSYAQPKDTVVTLEQCIEYALYGNYSIRIAENDLQMARNNVTLAPFLPTLSAGATQRQSITSKNAYNSSGDMSDSQSTYNDIGLSATLNWTIFDGLKMFATREVQKELLAQGELNFMNSVQNLVAGVVSQYYLIIRMQSQEKLLQEVVNISKIRHEQATTRYLIGSDSGLEYKQAKIYLNSDSTSLLVQRENLHNAYIELYRMMNVPFNSQLIIRDTIIKEGPMYLDNLKEKMFENNLDIRRIRSGETLSELDVKLAQSERYPKLNFSAGYNYSTYTSTYYAPKFDQSNGANWGFSLSVPIFSGNEINRKVKNAKLSQENARLSVEEGEQILESRLLQQYNTYTNNLRLIDFENENTEAAYLNLDAAMEKYRLGALSGIEFREIQMSYLNASYSKLNAQYVTKMSEIELHILAGDLWQF